MSDERYIIREIEGFVSPNGGGIVGTDVMVLDSDDCYRVVAYYSGEGRGGNQGTRSLPMLRRYTRRLAEELNAA